MRVSLFLIRSMFDYLRDTGANTEFFLREVGINEQQLAEPDGLVELPVVIHAGRAAYLASNDPALGLHLGERAQLHMLGMLGSLFVQCATLRTVVRELQRYLPLLASRGTLTLLEEGQSARMVLLMPLHASSEQRFIVEYTFAFMVRVARQFVGELSAPREVRLPFARPLHGAEYERIFRCPVQFDAERAELVFDANLLERRQAFADERLGALLKSRADMLLANSLHSLPMHQRVHDLLREDFALLDSGAEQLARRLGMSVRTMRRRLSAEGKPLLILAEEARRALAEQLLGETDTPVKQISERLGYSEPSAFHRAFKRWTSETPVSFRGRKHALLLKRTHGSLQYAH